MNGILAAAGPGIQPADLPEGSEIVQLPATILRLCGLSAEGLDGAPLAAILEEEAAVTAAEAVTPETPREASDEPVYSEEEERQMVERLRDLGYE